MHVSYEDQQPGNSLSAAGKAEFRGYVLAHGDFDLTRNWSWGFSAERTSDTLLFDKYNVPNVYQDHGLYGADTQRLVSQLYTTRQDTRSRRRCQWAAPVSTTARPIFP